MADFINICAENLAQQNLCCALADKKHIDGVLAKKDWLRERFCEGHVFRKLDENGKVFIEYAPLEKAWTPIVGDNYMYIYCLWVAGSHKGAGYGAKLLEYAIADAKERGMNGLCTVSTKKKKPFVSEGSFFAKYGFGVCDTAGEYQLLSLDFTDERPAFAQSAKQSEYGGKGLTVLYSPQCPYTLHCTRELRELAQESGCEITIIPIDTLEKAKNAPCVFNNWANFLDGKYVSATLLNKNSAAKLLGLR